MSPTIHIPSPTHSFAVIGGDGRMTYLSERLAEAGHTVSVLGCGTDCFSAREGTVQPRRREAAVRRCATLQKATETATALILPLPCTRDGQTVWCPREPTLTVTLDEIADLLVHRPTLYLFGGCLPRGFADRLRAEGCARVMDYYENESLKYRNAYITAEAALMTAMELTDRTLRGTAVAVLGYGRIGSMLARLLAALGAEVTVAARREDVLVCAAAEGYHTLWMSEAADRPVRPDRSDRCDRSDRVNDPLLPLCVGYPLIFNTIPAPVLKAPVLSRMERGTIILDLASAPFGADPEAVREASAQRGIHYVRAPSLPGSYAPRDTGYIMADCVMEILSSTASAKGGNDL